MWFEIKCQKKSLFYTYTIEILLHPFRHILFLNSISRVRGTCNTSADALSLYIHCILPGMSPFFYMYSVFYCLDIRGKGLQIHYDVKMNFQKPLKIIYHRLSRFFFLLIAENLNGNIFDSSFLFDCRSFEHVDTALGPAYMFSVHCGNRREPFTGTVRERWGPTASTSKRGLLQKRLLG